MIVKVSVSDLLHRLPPDMLAEIYRLLSAQATCGKQPDRMAEALQKLVREQGDAVIGADAFGQMLDS